MRIRVLWIDDDYKKQLDVIGDAEQDNIDIIAFESHEEGIADLNKNLSNYHAVILDAKVKHNKGDTVTDLKGLRASRDRLIEINKEVYLPHFIFTGNPDYQDKDWFVDSYGHYFVKGRDNQKLFDAIKESVLGKEEYIIEKKYNEVFRACKSEYFEEEIKKYLMVILKDLEYPSLNFEDVHFFNGIRKVVEHVFRASNKMGFLHDKCLQDGKVNLAWSSLFMAGNEIEVKPSNVKIKCDKSHFPVILANNVKSLLEITSAASHTAEEKAKGKANFADYKKLIITNYLLYSLAYQVMDLLLWFKNYADQNPDPEINKMYWRENVPIITGNWISGKVTQISDKGFGTFKADNDGTTLSIPPHKVNGLKIGDQIELTTKPDPNNNTKTHIDQLRKK